MKKHTRVVKMDKKQFEVHLCSEMYFFERAIILIFDLRLLISVAAAVTKLYGLIVKTSDC